MALPADVANLLRSFRLQSTLELTATPGPIVSWPITSWRCWSWARPPHPAAAVGDGLPLRTARFIPVSAEAGGIQLNRHGFTLRLGTAARLALERGSWRAGIPAGHRRVRDGAVRQRPLPGTGHAAAGLCRPVGAGLPAGDRADGMHDQRLHRRRRGAGASKLAGVFTGLDGLDLDLSLEGFARSSIARVTGWPTPSAPRRRPRPRGRGPATCARQGPASDPGQLHGGSRAVSAEAAAPRAGAGGGQPGRAGRRPGPARAGRQRAHQRLVGADHRARAGAGRRWRARPRLRRAGHRAQDRAGDNGGHRERAGIDRGLPDRSHRHRGRVLGGKLRAAQAGPRAVRGPRRSRPSTHRWGIAASSR